VIQWIHLKGGTDTKTFVAGGTGFIGTHVVRRLIQAGHEPHCLVRATSNTRELERVGVAVFTGDVTDKASLLEGMDGCDWVVNLANIYSWWEPDRRIYGDTNIGGTRNVMECALETDVSKVVHVSTAYVYGKPATCPFTEETPVGPVRPSEYSRTKYAGELIAWQLCRERGLPLVMIYPGVVLGAGDPKPTGRYIEGFVTGHRSPMAYTEAVHTFVYVGDVAKAIVLALEKEDNIGEKYLVGKHRLSIQEFSELLSDISRAALPARVPGAVAILICTLDTWWADLTKKPPKLTAMDYLRVIRDGCRFDGSKAERELGLTYAPIRDILEEAIESFR
jgi:dihydroflavonol-4-reductase